MRKFYREYVFIVTILLLIAGCTSLPSDVRQSDQLPDIYPDYIGVTIPTHIAPLNFAMSDDNVTTIDVTIEGSNGTYIHENGAYTDFDIDEWHRLLEQNKGRDLKVTVCAEKDGQWTGYRPFSIHVSQEAMNDWGITYRRIAPSYEVYSHMGLFQRELSSFDETVILENRKLKNSCMNCHTPNRTNPDQYTFHVRGEHGTTAIVKNGSIELLKASNDTLGGSMVYASWHPEGRYCAFSTNKTQQMFHTNNPKKRIEVFDTASDVFVYDTETHSILADSLIMKQPWAENCPAFSPDGKWLYFTTALRQNYPDEYDKEKYSLCRVSFDTKTGRIGTEVDTLVNSRTTHKSITWPRVSYDGRFLMYTEMDYGYFSVWHPEADLWLIDLNTGDRRLMKEVNSQLSESLHSWSLNSRWFLFTSRREDGLYTRLYLSSIDVNGKATKPFLLPQRNPKNYYRRLMYSYNTPDFTSRPVETEESAVVRQLQKPHRTATHLQ